MVSSTISRTPTTIKYLENGFALHVSNLNFFYLSTFSLACCKASLEPTRSQKECVPHMYPWSIIFINGDTLCNNNSHNIHLVPKLVPFLVALGMSLSLYGSATSSWSLQSFCRHSSYSWKMPSSGASTSSICSLVPNIQYTSHSHSWSYNLELTLIWTYPLGPWLGSPKSGSCSPQSFQTQRKESAQWRPCVGKVPLWSWREGRWAGQFGICTLSSIAIKSRKLSTE